MVLMISAALGQKMSKKTVSPFMPNAFAVMQKAQKDSIEQGLFSLKSLMTNPNQPDYGDKMPNGLKEKIQVMIYKGNNGRGGSIYQSTLDNMLLVAPDSSFKYNMPTGEYKILQTPVKPNSHIRDPCPTK